LSFNEIGPVSSGEPWDYFFGEPAGAELLLGELGKCKALTHLNLNSNRIGEEGAELLAGVLGECKALAHLNLNGNFISAEGAGRLAGVQAGCWWLRVVWEAGPTLGSGSEEDDDEED